MVLRFCPREVVYDVREKRCFSRKETTNENIVKVKELLNVAVVYWHYVHFTGITFSLLALRSVYQRNRKALLFGNIETGGQLPLIAVR